MEEVDWLPAAGWDRVRAAHEETAGRMGDFIARTIELHKFYLERLQEVKEEGQAALPGIAGVLDTPLMPFAEAAGPVLRLFASLKGYVKRAEDFGEKVAGTPAAGGVSAAEVAALHLYTTESCFYRELNAALRSPNRDRVKPYFPYLRLFFAALSRLEGRTQTLWRGVALELRRQYPRGGTVVWWGVSSCTSELSVARGFLGWSGRRTLFEVQPAGAVGIRNFSAFKGEEEYLLPPGTQLEVVDVKSEKGGLCTVKLRELPDKRLVS
jgi:hypothetical protein